jgi:hypothetical protein
LLGAFLVVSVGIVASSPASALGVRAPQERVTHAALSKSGAFCTNAKWLNLAWRRYLELSDPLDPQAIHARIFYSEKFLGRMLKAAPGSIASTVKAQLQTYQAYDKSMALVGYSPVPDSPDEEQTIHDALLAFAHASSTQLPPLIAFVKKGCGVDLNIAASPTPST